MSAEKDEQPQPPAPGGWIAVLFQIVLLVLVMLVLFYSVLFRGGFFR